MWSFKLQEGWHRKLGKATRGVGCGDFAGCLLPRRVHTRTNAMHNQCLLRKFAPTGRFRFAAALTLVLLGFWLKSRQTPAVARRCAVREWRSKCNNPRLRTRAGSGSPDQPCQVCSGDEGQPVV